MSTNTNPALLIALAIEHARKSIQFLPAEAAGQQIELRIYDPRGGTGYFFVRAGAAGRWYYMSEAGADGYHRADPAEMEAAVQASARVQLVGYHARNLGVWPTWAAFAEAMA